MNTTLQLLRRDLAHFRWALITGAVSFVFLFAQSQLGLVRSADLRDGLQLAAFLVLSVCAMRVIAGLMQETATPEPASAGRRLAAKLLLIVAVFVALPVLVIWLKNQVVSLKSMAYAGEYLLAAAAFAALALSFAAAAACTRSTMRAGFFWATVVFGSGTLLEALTRWSPAGYRAVSRGMTMGGMTLVLGVGVLVAVGIIIQQQLRRRLSLLAVTAVVLAAGAALVGSLWSYHYFYAG